MGLLISLYYAILIVNQMVPNVHLLLLNVLADSYRCKKNYELQKATVCTFLRARKPLSTP